MPSVSNWMQSSQFFRVLLIGFLALLLQIPTFMVQNLVNDRASVRQQAITDITSKWGQAQTIVGPQLVVPYVKRTGSGDKIKSEVKAATFLPESLAITTNMESEVRYRGIFEVPVYKSTINLNGEFLKPDFSPWNVKPDDILWDRAELDVAIADAKAIQNQASVQWNNAQISFAPGLGKLGTNASGIHANLSAAQLKGDRLKFSIPLQLNGSEKLAFAPFGKVTNVQVTSNWNSPSFQGPWLPTERSLTPQGFTAKWEIPSLGRNYPQQWTSEAPTSEQLIQTSVFGVDLISPVDNYRMADRSVKYNVLFVLLTFVALWLFELTAQVQIHPLQYLLVGVAMCLFYLLQLAISEHIGFHYAYAIASFAVVMLITTYAMGVLGAKKRGGVIGVMQVGLYSYLYVVLANQDYSLLIGSLGLFVFLAVVMFLTRRMNHRPVQPSHLP